MWIDTLSCKELFQFFSQRSLEGCLKVRLLFIIRKSIMSPLPTDAWGHEVTVSNGLLRYRNRAIDLIAVSEYRVKGKRVFINYYRGNESEPKAIIICKDVAAADALYEYILEVAYPSLKSKPLSSEEIQQFMNLSLQYVPKCFELLFPSPTPKPLTLWTFLGCGRH